MGDRVRVTVAELFAGVGGFRLGLERASMNGAHVDYRVVWSNQWEPSTKKQDASDLYVSRFGPKGHVNLDIKDVDAADIPNHDLLVGGFPCQDYSVARTLNEAAGLVGKKGVLWWEIHRILEDKGGARPRFLLLENVDRLLKSPAKQRGRDFAIMLASLMDLGYVVEWRVINAADYGMPQRRRRVFVLAYQEQSGPGERAREQEPADWMLDAGPLARAFPVRVEQGFPLPIEIEGDLAKVSDGFNVDGRYSPFENAGVGMRSGGKRLVWTAKVLPSYVGERTTLGDVVIPEQDVPETYFIPEEELELWTFFKGAKSVEKTSRRSGHRYRYAEGEIPFPDPLDRPSRTVVTGEVGRYPSRFKHVVKTPTGRYRRLTPVELERLNMFPDEHTAGVSEAKRAFLMGNALVVGVVEAIATELGVVVNEMSREVADVRG